MSSETFILKSGARFLVNTAPFQEAAGLLHAVKRVMAELKNEVDVSVLYTHPEVDKALWAVFPYTLYENERPVQRMFDDIKVGERMRGDYFEMCDRVIAFNCKPFFLTISSSSKISPQATSESQVSS